MKEAKDLSEFVDELPRTIRNELSLIIYEPIYEQVDILKLERHHR